MAEFQRTDDEHFFVLLSKEAASLLNVRFVSTCEGDEDEALYEMHEESLMKLNAYRVFPETLSEVVLRVVGGK